MQLSSLVRRNLIYYWRSHLAVVLGVGVAVSVLTGALVVGDSVRRSLTDLFLERLGAVDEVVFSSRFFREQLAEELRSSPGFSSAYRAVCPIIVSTGIVSHQLSGARATQVQVYGIDGRFWRFHAQAFATLSGRELLVSSSLARELKLQAGEPVLVRVERPSSIPRESLHGRRDQPGQTMRFIVKEVLPAAGLGEFSIYPQQSSVRAVFVPLKTLQNELAQPDRVNTFLISASEPRASASGLRSTGTESTSADRLPKLIRKFFALEDLGIRLRPSQSEPCLILEQETLVLSKPLIDDALATAEQLNMRPLPVLTYLANCIEAPRGKIPYSLVSAVDLPQMENSNRENALWLNEWSADDLNAQPGDPIALEYDVWLDNGKLTTKRVDFQVAGVLPTEIADPDFAPLYPGITDAESVSDWEPPFPIDLSRIRPQDERYWDEHGATPKAFIPLQAGQRLWSSRFGQLTSIRFYDRGARVSERAAVNERKPLPGRGSVEQMRERFAAALRARLDPSVHGLQVLPARTLGLEAAKGTTDFGQYFLYFSFFLVAAALLLTGMFFKLSIEQRLRQIGLLRAVGFTPSRLRTLFLCEGLLLLAIGTVLGVLGGSGYGWLIMLGLRTWWIGAVQTTSLALHLSIATLFTGAAAGIATGFVFIAWSIRQVVKSSPRALLTGARSAYTVSSDIPAVAKAPEAVAKAPEGRKNIAWGVSPRSAAKVDKPRRGERNLFYPAIGTSSLLAGLLCLLLASFDAINESLGFFTAGVLLLTGLLALEMGHLKRPGSRLRGSGLSALCRLGFRNASFRPDRSIVCVALIAAASFILVSVDAFRRESPEQALEPTSGTGGFPLMATSLLPLHYDPNTPEGREELNLTSPLLEGIKFTSLRVRPGDDVSCLSLYQPQNPRIAAVPASLIESGRFRFEESLAGSRREKENPWLLLKQDNAGELPVIADAVTLRYVLHRSVGETLSISHAGKAIRLKIVGSLKDSIFQGELLISESTFLRHFPELEGFRSFLIEAPADKVAAVSTMLEERLEDWGFDVEPAVGRLERFHQVENTYIATFQSLGGLGLVLGTLGLAAVLWRNVLERRRELALLQAVGYNSFHFSTLVLAENLFLLLLGALTGFAAALLAIAPVLVSRGDLPAFSIRLLAAVLVVGATVSLWAAWRVLRTPLLPALGEE